MTAGAVERRRGRYRMKEEWVWDELVLQALNDAVRDLAAGKAVLRGMVRRQSRGKALRVESTITRQGESVPRLEIGWVV
ncbi:MAG: hypothetical protein ACLP74_08320 [Thermoplasmata archaeon]